MLIDITDTVQLTHTAAEVDEDIDGSVRGDVAQLKDDTWKAQARDNIGAKYSNRNLLYNWWFGKGVINQRGQSSYTGRGYTIDMWTFDDATGVLQVNNGYITLTSTGTGSGSTDFEQFLDLSEYIGKELTASVMLSDGTVRSGTAVFNTVTTGIAVPIADGFTLYLGYYSSKSLNRVYIRNAGNRSGNSILIKAMKLEPGSVSTLGNDMPPDYATELLKCQRYLFVLEDFYAPGISQYNGTLSIAVPTSTTMASVPTPSVLAGGEMAWNNFSSWQNIGALPTIYGKQAPNIYYTGLGTTARGVYNTHFAKFALSAEL